jgi:hypothetical protein
MENNKVHLSISPTEVKAFQTKELAENFLLKTFFIPNQISTFYTTYDRFLVGGAAPVTGVLDYTEYCLNNGLHLLCTSGNDVESTTALVGSGCNVVVFTTDLGTPTGYPVAAVIKMSSNNNLVEKMKDIIDFNTGDIITGKESIEDAPDRLLNI